MRREVLVEPLLLVAIQLLRQGGCVGAEGFRRGQGVTMCRLVGIEDMLVPWHDRHGALTTAGVPAKTRHAHHP